MLLYYKFLRLPLLFIVIFYTQSTLAQGFTDVTTQAGIQHAFRVDLATFGGGVVVIDYDNDGWEDLYITGGADPDVLYQNQGDGTFVNRILGSGLESTQGYYTQGVATADVDGDGLKDLIITTFTDMTPARRPAPNLIFKNEGNGRFSDKTGEWGLQNYRVNSCGASFGDINNDGYPDLYVSNYYSSTAIGFNLYNEQTITNSFTPALDYLFINNAGKGFVEVGEYYGLREDGFGFQAVFTDYDLDGDLDILLANDFGFRRTPNRLYRNDYPKRGFTDRSLQAALNYGMNAMGIAVADYNFDGYQDYFITNLGTSVFSVSQGEGAPFADYTFFSGIGTPQIEDSLYTGIPISWGANFFDYDNDADYDLFVCNGALNPTLRLNPNLFYVCNDNQQYEMKAQENGLFHYGIGRGSVVFDYDKDGDLDLFVVNQYPRENTTLNGTLPPSNCVLYRNETNSGNWLQISLKGRKSTTNGLGSRVVLYSGGRMQTQEIDGGSSHLSQNSDIAHFGLGENTRVDSVVIHWIGGQAQRLTELPINQRIIVEQTESAAPSVEKNRLSAFPTTFQDFLFYEFASSGSGAIQIDLIDQSGRVAALLYESQDAPTEAFFRWQPSAGLANGIYYLRMIQAGQVTTVPVSYIR